MGERARSTATPGRGRGGNGKRAEQPQSSGRGREAGKTQAPEQEGRVPARVTGKGKEASGRVPELGQDRGRGRAAGRGSGDRTQSPEPGKKSGRGRAAGKSTGDRTQSPEPGKESGRGRAAGRGSGDRTQSPEPGKKIGRGRAAGKGTGDRTQSPEPGKESGRGRAAGRGSGDRTQSPEPGKKSGRGRAAGRGSGDRTQSPEPGKESGRGRAAGRGSGDRTQSPEPGKKSGRGRAAGRGSGDRTQSPEPGKKSGRGRAAGRGSGDRTQSPEPGKESGRGRAAGRGSGDRTQSPEPGKESGRGRAAGRGSGDRTQSPEPGKKSGRGRAAGRGSGDRTQSPEPGKKSERAAGTGDRTQSPEPGKESGRAEMAAPEPVGRRRGSKKGGSGDTRLREVEERLRARAEKCSREAKRVSHLVDQLVRKIQECSLFSKLERAPTGSFQEGVQISEGNEFEIMLKMPIPRIELKSECGGDAFYSVKFKRGLSKHPLKDCLDENENLSSSMMLSKLRKIIKEKAKEEMNVSVQGKKPGSPAVTLLVNGLDSPISVDIVLVLEVQQNWPLITSHGLNIEQWLGRKRRRALKFEPFYLVPKQIKHGRTTKEIWCLSFPHIEKEILSNHGNSKTCCESNGLKCCRKACLRLLKYLLQNLQEKSENKKRLDKFCSYHAKTLFFHTCVSYPSDTNWQLNDLDSCFEMLVNDFVKCLHKEKLPHFFITSLNLFDPEDLGRTNLEILAREIEFQRNNNFPVFTQ
ncbi:cyclic GMP-AMP synthase-like isoform X1 [Rhinatrema bivittatum]|uniref:cyclic GMP-AMP synthase-like isoform X1 n=1 Tax=Rhinatrema bivittatum TaxID=194408 RepID=UPI00112CBF1E|nr:cyclic GMP-AMP synthase-like isoform X1 [Rhinatrema bivittatum]